MSRDMFGAGDSEFLGLPHPTTAATSRTNSLAVLSGPGARSASTAGLGLDATATATATAAAAAAAAEVGAESHAATTPQQRLTSQIPAQARGPPPSPAHSWARIQAWASEMYPEVYDTLNYGAPDEELDELERTLGRTLPPAVRDSLRCINGQDVEDAVPGGSSTDGMFFGLPMLSVEQILREWTFWRQVDRDPDTGASTAVNANMSSCPAEWVQPHYSHPAWVPLITDRVGNYIGIDLDPPPLHPDRDLRTPLDFESPYDRIPSPQISHSSDDTPALALGEPNLKNDDPQLASSNKSAYKAAAGQVIAFGRDFDTKVVLWQGDGPAGWAHFLEWFASELERGTLYTLDASALTDSETEEDLIGYEGYFSGSAHGGGASGRGGGEVAGDGLAGFALKGPYSGWPTLEAIADRSIQLWSEAGLPPGTPANQLPGYRPEDTPVEWEENKVGDDPEPTKNKRRPQSQYPYLPPTLLVHRPEEEEEQQQEGSEPKTRDVSDVGNLTNDHAEIMLDASPGSGRVSTEDMGGAHPLASAYSPTSSTFGPNSRSSTMSSGRRAIPPPAPTSALDLPTLADVKAAEAAALAELARGASQQHHLDLGPDVRTDPYRLPTYSPVLPTHGLALNMPIDHHNHHSSGPASPSEVPLVDQAPSRVVAYAPRTYTSSPVPPMVPSMSDDREKALPNPPALSSGPLDAP